MTVEEIKKLELDDLIRLGEFDCVCGKKHSPGVKKVVIEKGAINSLPDLLKELGAVKPFLLSGHDTFAVAGGKVCDVLTGAGYDFSSYVFPVSPVKPTEHTVGSAVMHFDYSCDVIIGIGSGVVNDTSKILSRATGIKYIIVGTAPSMDGFLAGTSAMERDGLKVSLPSAAPWAVVGDLDILCNAPMHMLVSGVGDMLAKITSLREWKLAEIIIGEEYCPVTAALVEKALDKVTSQADLLLKRDPDAVKSVMEGLLIAGMAMYFVGVSRPASGMEHYFSHIWDMRALAFPECRSELHGIQAGMGTLYTIRAYETLIRDGYRPEEKRAFDYVRSFSVDGWNGKLRGFIGPGAEAMIEGENRERKYDVAKHAARFRILQERWDDITAVIRTLPSSEELEKLMVSIGAPVSASCIGYTDEQVKTAFTMTKDIRDKYVGTRLFWDLGILEEIADRTFG